MAKRKRSSRRPQPAHKKQKKSQHDEIRRLRTRNADRGKTCNAKVPLVGVMRTMIAVLQAVMDPRIAFRLAIIVAGMFLADGRHAASAWFVAAGARDDWDRFLACLISVGRTSGQLATAVGHVISAPTPRPPCATSWKRLARAGRLKNTSTTSRKFGARDSNKCATCGRTLVVGT